MVLKNYDDKAHLHDAGGLLCFHVNQFSMPPSIAAGVFPTFGIFIV
jgi:hypothetical protein